MHRRLLASASSSNMLIVIAQTCKIRQAAWKLRMIAISGLWNGHMSGAITTSACTSRTYLLRGPLSVRRCLTAQRPAIDRCCCLRRKLQELRVLSGGSALRIRAQASKSNTLSENPTTLRLEASLSFEEASTCPNCS